MTPRQTLHDALKRHIQATPHERAKALVAAGIIEEGQLDEIASRLVQKDLTAAEWAALEEVRDFTRSGLYAGMFTGRTFRRRVAQSLKEKKLLHSRVMDVAGADGHIRDGAKPREGYFPTWLGSYVLDNRR